jgi:hypothetical protein
MCSGIVKFGDPESETAAENNPLDAGDANKASTD